MHVFVVICVCFVMYDYGNSVPPVMPINQWGWPYWQRHSDQTERWTSEQRNIRAIAARCVWHTVRCTRERVKGQPRHEERSSLLLYYRHRLPAHRKHYTSYNTAHPGSCVRASVCGCVCVCWRTPRDWITSWHVHFTTLCSPAPQTPFFFRTA